MQSKGKDKQEESEITVISSEEEEESFLVEGSK